MTTLQLKGAYNAPLITINHLSIVIRLPVPLSVNTTRSTFLRCDDLQAASLEQEARY